MIGIAITVRNEKNSIKPLLQSILEQAMSPAEVIVTDGYSNDGTFEILEVYREHFKKKGIKFNAFQVTGNRSKGRNAAIKQISTNKVLVTDAGCTLHKDWVKKMDTGFASGADVVSGYYKPYGAGQKNSQTIFQKCLAAYTSVMPDSLDEDSFLPSSRSIGFTKKAWEKVGGYDESLDYAEDLVFARALKAKGLQFVMVKDAIVYWPQRRSLAAAINQFYEYALGDGYVQYFRPTAAFLFGRYLVGAALLVFSLMTGNARALSLLGLLFAMYLAWAIRKNYRYVNNPRALIYLPLLQITSDLTVIAGNVQGVIRKLDVARYFGYQLIGKIITASVGFLVIALLTRELGPTGFSQYSFAFSAATFAFLFANLGLDPLIIREIARKNDSPIVQQAFALRLIASTVVMGILGLFVSLTDYSTLVKIGIVLAGFSSFFNILAETIWAAMKGRLHFKKVILLQVLISCVILAFTLIGVFRNYGVSYFVGSHAAGFLAGLIGTLAYWDRPHSSIQGISRRNISLLKKMKIFLLLFVLGIIYFKVDVLVLAYFFNPDRSSAVGLYTLAYKPFELAVLIGGYYTQTLLPYFTIKRKNSNINIAFYQKLTVVLALLAAVFIFLLAKPYVMLVGGSEFLSSIQSLQILSLAAGFTIIAGFYNSKLLAEKSEQKVLMVYMLAVVVNVVGNLIAVPAFSYVGASWMTVITQAVIMIGLQKA